MKKLIAGIALLISGILTEGFLLIAGAAIVPTIKEWYNTLGKFWYGISSNGLMAIAVLAGIVAVAGLILTLVAACSKEK